MGLTKNFKNWLMNTPGVAATEKMSAPVERAKSRTETAESRAKILAALRSDRSVDPNSAWSQQQLEDYLVCARYAAAEKLDLEPFDSQLLAVANMLGGTALELETGEGKTLVGALVAAAHGLGDRKVHVLTVNDYLARRDAQWMAPFYESMGITVAAVVSSNSREERKAAYAADVVYVSVNELGFDVLRDNTIVSLEQKVLQGQDVCIIDEIDSVLVDESVVPLVLAGSARDELEAVDVAEFVRGLIPGTDYLVDPDKRNVSLSDAGIAKTTVHWPGVELFSAEGTPLFASINTALHAEALLERDVDYIVRDGKAQIVSDSRGRVATTQRWPDGLQAAVETKEGLVKTEQGEILDQLLIKDLVKEFTNVTGMSGTTVAVSEYLKSNYGLNAGRIEPHVPSIREDLPERIYATDATRDAAVVREVTQAHATGRPVLVATHSVGDSERLAARLEENGVSAQLLNARNDQAEAAIIAQAGRRGAVTVSTQMAGRGTDIILGGVENAVPGAKMRSREHTDVAGLGGLLVVIVGRFLSSRLDAQLRGRAGRQGDPGTSVIFSSMADPSNHGQPQDATLLSEAVSQDADDDGLLARADVSPLLDKAQRMAEQERFTTQENSWKYNELISQQRKAVLRERELLLSDDTAVLEFFDGNELLTEREKELGHAGLIDACRALVLFSLDSAWSDHLALLAEQRAAIHLRALGRQNPLDEYRKETILAFEGFLDSVIEESNNLFDALPVIDGIADLEAAGVRRPSSTWTYVVNEDPFANPSDQIIKWLLKKMGK